jgi:hypothetical protein
LVTRRVLQTTQSDTRSRAKPSDTRVRGQR